MAGILTFIDPDTEVSLQANYYNILPTSGATTGDRPLTAMTVLNDGRMVAGVYNLSFSSVTPGVSGIAVINTADINNPWKTAAKTVYLDDDQTDPGAYGTAHNDLIGGLGIYFSSDADFATSWTAKVIVGGQFLSGGNDSITSFGTIAAGTTSAYQQIGVKNTGDADCTDCVLGIYPGSYFKNITNTPIDSIKVTAKSAAVGKYTLSCIDYSSPADTIDVWVQYNTYNYTTQAWVISGSNTLKGSFLCDGTTAHSTIITGVEIVLNSDLSSNSEANIYIESTSGARIAPDITGTPGSFVTSDIILTESGGVTGTIQDGNVALFWLCVMSNTSDKPGNLRKFTLRPSGMSLGDLVE